MLFFCGVDLLTVELAFDYRLYSNLRLASNFYLYQIEDSISAGSALKVDNQEGQIGYGTEFEWDWQFHPQWTLKVIMFGNMPVMRKVNVE